MRIADRIRTGTWRDDLRRLETRWRDATTPTVAQSADAATKKYQAGIVPLRQTREDLNYSDEQIRLMEEEDARNKTLTPSPPDSPPVPAEPPPVMPEEMQPQ